MHSGLAIGVIRNMSLRSRLMHWAPSAELEMTLLNSILVSNMLVAKKLVSSLQSSKSPSINSLIGYCSSFNSWWSHANATWMIFVFFGTEEKETKLVMLAEETLASLPSAKLPHSLLSTSIYLVVTLSWSNRLLMVNLVPDLSYIWLAVNFFTMHWASSRFSAIALNLVLL